MLRNNLLLGLGTCAVVTGVFATLIAGLDGGPTAGGAQSAPPLVFPPPATNADSDSDGCSDFEELGRAPGLGGQRDLTNFWDFYDVPTAAGVRNRAVNVGDIVVVVSRFGTNDAGGTAQINRDTDPLSLPPPTGYHPSFDRGGRVPDAENPWNLAPPDGAVTVGDIVAIVLQFGHNCIADDPSAAGLFEWSAVDTYVKEVLGPAAAAIINGEGPIVSLGGDGDTIGVQVICTDPDIGMIEFTVGPAPFLTDTGELEYDEDPDAPTPTPAGSPAHSDTDEEVDSVSQPC